MSDDPIHLYERPKFRNFCGAKQWTPMPHQAQHGGFVGGGPAYKWTPTVKRDQIRTDAFPRARNCVSVGEVAGETAVAAIITFGYLTAEEDAVVIPQQKLCAECYLVWSVMQANGLKTKAAARRLMLQSLEKPK